MIPQPLSESPNSYYECSAFVIAAVGSTYNVFCYDTVCIEDRNPSLFQRQADALRVMQRTQVSRLTSSSVAMEKYQKIPHLTVKMIGKKVLTLLLLVLKVLKAFKQTEVY